MLKVNVDPAYPELCDELGMELLGLDGWVEKLRAEGVTGISIELRPEEPTAHIVQAWNPKWLGGAAGTGIAATDVEAAAGAGWTFRVHAELEAVADLDLLGRTRVVTRHGLMDQLIRLDDAVNGQVA